MIKLVIFDFDDTLIDNDKLDYQSFVLSFKKVGLPIPTLKEITKLRKKGFLAKEITKKYLRINNKLPLLSNILSYRNEFLSSDKAILYFRLKKSTKQLLRLLKSKKINCILCSSRDNKNLVINFLRQQKISNFFSNFYFKEDFGINIENSNISNRILIKKKLLKQIINDESIKPNQVLFIGNSKEDLLAAKKNEVNFIYFQNSYLPTAPMSTKLVIVDNIMTINKKLDEF